MLFVAVAHHQLTGKLCLNLVRVSLDPQQCLQIGLILELIDGPNSQPHDLGQEPFNKLAAPVVQLLLEIVKSIAHQHVDDFLSLQNF